METKPVVIVTDIPDDGREPYDAAAERARTTGAWIAHRHKVLCGALGEQIYVEGGADDEGIAEQIAELHAIVEELASREPWDDIGRCIYCVSATEHFPSCLWERARKAAAR